jgi:hypothetical protein
MTIQRMDNVGIVVDDLDAAVAFFTELGVELEGRMPIEGSWAGSVVGLDEMRSEIAMMRIPGGPGRLELAKYHTPKAITPKPEITPANTFLRRCTNTLDHLAGVTEVPMVAPRSRRRAGTGCSRNLRLR